MEIPEAFDWDEYNREKNWVKHGVSVKECEQAFFNKSRIVWKDTKHSVGEERFILLGKTNIDRGLHIVFTIRKRKVRIISARSQNKKERSFYANQKN